MLEEKDPCVSKEKNEIQRSPDEIAERIYLLQEEIESNNIWVDTGIISKSPDPVFLEKQDILNGKILELKWMLGEEIEITAGLI